MKMVVLIMGVIGVLVGLLWMGQGSGYVNWPASSFMINQRQWAWYGFALAIIGVALLYYSTRRRA